VLLFVPTCNRFETTNLVFLVFFLGFSNFVILLGAVAGITGGAIAGISVAAIIAALIAFWATRKTYDYYKNKTDMNAAGLSQNPYFKEPGNSGIMPTAFYK
jgi:hypothetical protein